MAKKRKKRYGKKRKSSGHRKSSKRVRAGKRAYKKSGLYKYNMRRKKKGYGKKGRGKKKSKRYGKRSGGLSTKGHQIYQAMINRGRTPQQAHKVAARLDRMRTGKVKRYFEKEAAQAKSAQQLSNLFANIGTAGHLHSLQSR